ncbi:hypothetical protein LOTGIDRAFT_167233 [Lottia gigantea]|uniref:Uncharacterized protein n=1 Tax=Lottia gigantea TaxID=225164 RepID=V4BDD5_LOTGI|nr:hypothetical protein LOTGIDRAFT_167233 [Lottia gigantea]ESO86419.1 hypothetical protein LOTGIDRAFT_167233 [Lottia gigantea]
MSAPTNPRVSKTKRKSRLPLSTNSKKKRSNGGSSNIAEGSSSSVGGSTVDDGGLHVCSLSQEAEDRIVDKLFNKLSNHGLLQTSAVSEVVSNQQAGAVSSEDIPSTLSSDGNISERDFLVRGFQEGFRIPFNGERNSVCLKIIILVIKMKRHSFRN